MIVTGYILLAILLVHFVVVLFNYLSKPYLPEAAKLEKFPLISILIPARNEEDNLPNLLSDIRKTDYPNYEVIVCNDHSTDKTLEILGQHQQNFPQLSFFTNQPLPDEWVGKNFACHQLAQKAKGDWLLFLDADVRIKPVLLNKAISYAQNNKLGLLSVFPEQIIHSTGEWKTIPIMNWILLSFLPLKSVQLNKAPSLAAANGQMMFFDAEKYRAHYWHEQVKNKNVEDILIARLIKKEGYPVSVLLGNNDVLCRMYNDYQNAINGFSLNIHQFFVGSRLWMVLFMLVTWMRLPFYILSQQYLLLVLSLILIVSIKYMYSSLSRLDFKKNMQHHPDQLWAFTLMVLNNLKNKKERKIEWKGRIYKA
ncbi:MAG: glycosyltransferase family 2 protein [Prolixibacteraceae bacterium]|jgi:glycosyltransferase involved in cell wall biosynthesis|nr:glycosyltransferase family 2 protein [Prolixibacteraceae bacterium]